MARATSRDAVKKLSEPSVVDEILRRLERLRPDSDRQWGRMNADQMVCHLSDAFRAVSGEKRVGALGTWLHRTVIKWVALRTPMPWPQGVPTMPEVDQEKGGTPPAAFEADVSDLVERVRRFSAATAEVTRDLRHPLFGAMSHGDWMRWGYRHCDHHLRQFGV